MILNIVQKIINFVLPLPIFYNFSACRKDERIYCAHSPIAVTAWKDKGQKAMRTAVFWRTRP